MNEYLVRMLPRSSVESRLGADTLFGAFCWAIRVLYGERELVRILEGFNQAPLFVLSSAFPFKSYEDDIRYYLPMPIYPPIVLNELIRLAHNENLSLSSKPYHSKKQRWVYVSEKYKEFQKIQWISREHFMVTAGKGIGGGRILFQEYLEGRLSNPSWKSEQAVQKNSLDRLTWSTAGAGNTFYNTEGFMRDAFGFYFLLKTSDFSFIEPVLRLLEDSGIGANARTGKSRFLLNWEENEFTANRTGHSFVSLSRYINNGTIDFGRSYYDLEFVRSKVESREEFHGEDVWKDMVIYLKEGSIITPCTKDEYFGGIFPVKSIHGKTIYQYGIAYPFWGDFSKEIG